MQNTTLNLYPTTSLSTADLQQQLYLNMKSKPQDQVADPELWKILKANKDEKRVMYLVEIVKFCDATLERVKLMIFQNQFWKKSPWLGEVDLDIMRSFKREISKRLSHRQQMRREQMLLAFKDEAGAHLDVEENDFMLDNAYGDNTLEEINAAVIMMARIQPTDDKSDAKPTYDAEFISEELETCKEMVKEFENKLEQPLEKIREEILKTQDETLKIKHETDLYKKAFKERENKYLEDIVSLEEKLQFHDRIVYKMQHSLQTIHMLGKTPNNVYDPHLKTGLGYENPERLKKAIAAQPKMYDGEKLTSPK
ncbi:hypothetical protein Tco_1175643 [Tanacetum coccineum]